MSTIEEKRLTVDQLRKLFPNHPESFIRANAVDGAYLVPNAPKKPAKRVRQSSVKLNKTEQAFFDYLKAHYPGVDIGSQRIRLKLANGAWYKPDNDAFFNDVGLTCYEVKGYMRPKDALTIKVAAQQFPSITFELVTRRKDGGWDIEAVLP